MTGAIIATVGFVLCGTALAAIAVIHWYEEHRR